MKKEFTTPKETKSSDELKSSDFEVNTKPSNFEKAKQDSMPKPEDILKEKKEEPLIVPEQNPNMWKEDFEKTLVPEKKSQDDRTGHSEAKLSKKMPSVFKHKNKSHTHMAHTKAVSKNQATFKAEQE